VEISPEEIRMRLEELHKLVTKIQEELSGFILESDSILKGICFTNAFRKAVDMDVLLGELLARLPESGGNKFKS